MLLTSNSYIKSELWDFDRDLTENTNGRSQDANE